jgi:hypothetical protein
MAAKTDAALAISVARQIRVIRGQRVLLDEDLAAIYGVTTSALNQAMRRNRGRFPSDFVLELTAPEWESLRSQIVILKTGRGRHRKFLPVAFTEHGAVMAATILNSPQAVQMSILVVRAFIAMRSALQDSKQLATKLDALEKSLAIMDADTRRQFKELRAVVFALAAPPAKEQ